jgi:hypothetical protein
MSRITRREWYSRVNACWPDEVPALTAPEAISAARKLYRHVRGRKFGGEILVSSGNRYNDIRSGNIYVNPERGWKALVHELSHSILYLPHGGEHARLEMRMIKHVIKLGWLTGTLKAKPKAEIPKPDKRIQKLNRTLAAIGRWQKKERRAQNALKKLRRSLKAQERAMNTFLLTSGDGGLRASDFTVAH